MSRQASDAIRAALGGFDPSGEQWSAIAADPEPLVVVAGAGTGKTAIMAARIVHMVEERGVRPAQILGLTFTNRAAGELEERVHLALGLLDPPPADAPEIATYNSFADRLVRAHGVRVGVDPEVGLLSEAQRWQLVMRCLDEVPPFEYSDFVSTNWFCQVALGLADACANHDVTPEAVIAEDERVIREEGAFDPKVVAASHKRIEIMRLVSAYVRAKEEGGWIDFGDQVTKAFEILQGSASLVEELRGRYPAILLDEYQDTNVAQRKVLQLLAPAGHNITAVGDARQNIYQWRGSTIFNLIDFPKVHFLRAGDETHDYLSLSENFRSGSRILDVANRIIEPVEATRRPGDPLKPHEENGEGFVGTALLSDETAEAGFIAAEIERLHGSDLGPAGAAAWSSFAVLVRKKALIPAIYEALGGRDIPVEVVGLGGLLQVPEVTDTVAWLRVLADPGPQANRWLARILIGPRFRIHYRDLALLARWAARHTKELAEKKAERGDGDGKGSVVDETAFEPDEVAYSLTEALGYLDEIEGLGEEGRRRLTRARDDIESMRGLGRQSLLELVRGVVEQTGIAEELSSSPREDAASSLRNLTKFAGIVSDFQPVSGEASLEAFLEYLDAVEGAEENLDVATPSADDSVKLMTVHQAKGLEFGVVFVPGVAARENEKGEKVESNFPLQWVTDPSRSYGELPFAVREDHQHLPTPWATDDSGRRGPKPATKFREELKERAIEDERRLFYVALTRAKQRLYVTAAHWYERLQRPKGPSQFFEEVAEAPQSESVVSEEAPPENPSIERLAAELQWPPDRPHSIDFGDPFPEGHPVAIEALMSGEMAPEDLLARLDGESKEAAGLLEGHRRLISGIAAASQAPAGDEVVFSSLSATRAADLASGRVSLEEVLRPLPERPSTARRIGTEVHRWVEEQARGLMGLADEEELEEPSGYVEPSRIAQMKENFDDRWADRSYRRLESGEPMAELPFVLKVGDRLVRGRIDAVFETDEGGLEIVDFKTGKKVEAGSLDQLDVYAAALAHLGVEFTGPLTLTYAYLATGEEESRTISGEEAAAALDRLETELEAVASRSGR